MSESTSIKGQQEPFVSPALVAYLTFTVRNQLGCCWVFWCCWGCRLACLVPCVSVLLVTGSLLLWRKLFTFFAPQYALQSFPSSSEIGVMCPISSTWKKEFSLCDGLHLMSSGLRSAFELLGEGELSCLRVSQNVPWIGRWSYRESPVLQLAFLYSTMGRKIAQCQWLCSSSRNFCVDAIAVQLKVADAIMPWSSCSDASDCIGLFHFSRFAMWGANSELSFLFVCPWWLFVWGGWLVVRFPCFVVGLVCFLVLYSACSPSHLQLFAIKCRSFLTSGIVFMTVASRTYGVTECKKSILATISWTNFCQVLQKSKTAL